MQHEVERRTYGVELRAKDTATGGSTIEGYAAVFNSKSEDLGFREIIMPGAFDRALEESHDVRALWNHNSDMVLARTKSGTLRLTVDERGLKIEADMPDTQAGRDALTLIRRGDVDQMSFAFRTLTDEWRMEDGETIRELRDLELLDVSPVAYPAYAETQVSARAREQAKGTQPPPILGVPNSINEARLRLSRP